MPLSAPRQRRSAAVIAAVGAAALVAVAVGVALSARAQGRGELASHMEHYRLRCVLSRAIARCSAPALLLPLPVPAASRRPRRPSSTQPPVVTPPPRMRVRNSAKKSSSDMDSYFDNLPGGLPKSGAKHRKSHQHHAKHDEHAKHHAKHAKQEQPAAADVANPSKHSSKKLSSKDDLASIHEKIAQQIKVSQSNPVYPRPQPPTQEPFVPFVPRGVGVANVHLGGRPGRPQWRRPTPRTVSGARRRQCRVRSLRCACSQRWS